MLMTTKAPVAKAIDLRSIHLPACLFGLFSVLVLASLLQNIILFNTGLLDTGSKIWLLEVDEERSLYTWLSSTLMAFIGALNLLVALERRSQGRLLFLQWLVLSGIFFALSADEALSIHEKFGQIVSPDLRTGALRFAWVLPAGILCAIGLALYLPFIWHFPKGARLLLTASAATFLSGALGMEVVGGMMEEEDGVHSLGYRMVSSLEEALEGFGLILFLQSVLLYRRRHGTAMTIRL